jgi:hypothetical protein
MRICLKNRKLYLGVSLRVVDVQCLHLKLHDYDFFNIRVENMEISFKIRNCILILSPSL